jgi:hypothetical protein
MRGSTLLLHWKSEATLMRVQLRSAVHLSRIADLAPRVSSLVSLDWLLFFINVGAIVYWLWAQYNGDGEKMQEAEIWESPSFTHPIVVAIVVNRCIVCARRRTDRKNY